MKKQSVQKLKLFLTGLCSRYEDQKEYFIKLEYTLKSGLKEFQGSYETDDEESSWIFNKDKMQMSFDEAMDKIADQAADYDSLDLKYIQRGTTTIIEADDKRVLTKNEDNKLTAKLEKNTSAREYYIKASEASELLKEIGIMSQSGKIKNDMIRKYNQIDHFIEVVEPIISALDYSGSITIMDCACGKSYLSFVLNYYIKEVMKKNCTFIGIDYNENVIKSSQERAKRLGYNNMRFESRDLRTYTPDENIDMVISLHACDIATDYAIALGLRAKAKSLIMVPCCHKELKDQMENDMMAPLIKHKIFKARFNDFLTDSVRALFIESHGYEVMPLEYVSPIDTPKNLMIRAVKKSEYNQSAADEYNNIKKMFNIKPSMEKYTW